jgi:hypothetical protein
LTEIIAIDAKLQSRKSTGASEGIKFNCIYQSSCRKIRNQFYGL